LTANQPVDYDSRRIGTAPQGWLVPGFPAWEERVCERAACQMVTLMFPICHRQSSPPRVNDEQLLEKNAVMISNFIGKPFEEAWK
jgi:hypothetical protein